MPLTPTEFDELVKLTCPRCKAGSVPRFRDDTKEWVHDYAERGGFSHTFCLASGLKQAYDSGAIGGKPVSDGGI